MRILRLLMIGIAAGAFAACSSHDTNTANTTGQSTVNQTVQANQAVAQQGPAATALSPTDTLKALSQASAKKDVEGIKRYLSKGTLARLEIGAREQNKTPDEVLAEKDGAPFPQLPQLGKEEVQGNTATVEVLNTETRQFEKLPFVKEDGQWKVAIDVYLDNLDAAMEEEAQKPNSREQ